MNHTIYIYLALAAVIALGSFGLGLGVGHFHGYKRGKRNADLSEYRRGYLDADATNSALIRSEYKGGQTYQDRGRAVLSDLIHNHTKRMDRDD